MLSTLIILSFSFDNIEDTQMILFNKKILFCSVFLISIALQAVAADLTQIKATGKGKKTNLSNQDISGADLRDVYMDGSKFVSANMTGASLNDCGECDFSNANLTKVNFEKASIDEAEMNGAKLIEANLSKAYN